MKQGDKLYQIKDGNSPFSSQNTLLVCALLTLGAQLDNTQPFQELREVDSEGKPKRSVVWLLAEKTASGEQVKDLAMHWRDSEWIKANPEHPLAYVKSALENYRQLIAAVKSAVPLSVVRRGKKMVLIPENATAERRAELIGMLDT